MNSMTGFGRGGLQQDGREVAIEIRSVNHRYLDVSCRLPRALSFLEDTIRKCVSARFERGKLEIYVSYKNHREDKCSVSADAALAKDYLDVYRELHKELGVEDDTTLVNIATLPNVITLSENEEDADAVTQLVQGAAELACDGLAGMRRDEGAALKHDFQTKLGVVKGIVDDIEKLAPQAQQASSNRLMEKMKEYYEGDESIRQRVLTEAALIADRHAIDEELVRLRSHIAQFEAAMEEGGAVGRKMDFIVQEMNRETNTIGNKAQGTDIPPLVILCKSELEKLREQVQNIE